jgi:hypothetical protein
MAKLITPYVWSAITKDGEIFNQFNESGTENSVKILEGKEIKEIKLISLNTQKNNFSLKINTDKNEKFIKFWNRSIVVGIHDENILEKASEVLGIKKNINGTIVNFFVVIPNLFYEPIEVYCTTEDDSEV